MSQNAARYTRDPHDIDIFMKNVIKRVRKISDRQVTIERKIRRQFIIENKGR